MATLTAETLLIRVCLPSGSNLSDEDRDRIKSVFTDLFETQKKDSIF
jgi:hypothetical protein